MYKPNELKESTIGIYKKFPKLSTYAKSLQNFGVDYSKEIMRLEKYANGVEFTFSHMDEIQCKNSGLTYEPMVYTFANMKSDLNRYAIKRLIDSYLLCFEKNYSWEYVFKEAIVYRYWAHRMELNFHEMAYQEFMAGKRNQKLTMLSIRDIGVTVGFCISLGWIDYAKDLKSRINSALEKDLFYDGDDNFGRRRTQHFLIRLLNSFEGKKDIQEAKNIKCAYDVDLFNDLVTNWNTNNIPELIDLVTKACDRHTHQCRQDSWNSKRYYDFANVHFEAYYPLEIFSLFRLRKILNLEIPLIDHPLLSSPLASLFSSTDIPENKFLDSLITRAKHESEWV